MADTPTPKMTRVAFNAWVIAAYEKGDRAMLDQLAQRKP